MKSSMKNMTLSLGVVTLLAGGVLAVVHMVTQEPISRAASAKVMQAVSQVTPGFDNDPLAQAWEYQLNDGTGKVTVYPAYSGDGFVGAAVQSFSSNGFAGEIVVIYGFDASGEVSGFQVLEQEETPGLGAKMNEWFRSEEGSRSIIGKNPSLVSMRVTKDRGEIDGITAATISSRAFLEALRRAFEAFQEYKTVNFDNGNGNE